MPETSSRCLALKIDVDTHRGTRQGVPGLLDELDRAGVRATFFVSVGPDRSGLALARIFRKKGFLAKMLRTNAPRMYGWKTLLYGTLLPAPIIGEKNAAALRRIESAGHEVHLHAWDHVRWQDRLQSMPPAAIAAELERGIAGFQGIYGRKPRAFAAPAWLCTEDAFLALERCAFDYISVSRGPAPFRPVVGGRALSLVEIPTTLPTLDEMLGRDGITASSWNARLLGMLRPGCAEVLTIHAESEGLAYRPLFRDLLERCRSLGLEFSTLGELAGRLRAKAGGAAAIPDRGVTLAEIPGRAGKVAVAAG